MHANAAPVPDQARPFVEDFTGIQNKVGRRFFRYLTWAIGQDVSPQQGGEQGGADGDLNHRIST